MQPDRRAWLRCLATAAAGLAAGAPGWASVEPCRLALAWSEPGAAPQAERSQWAGVWQLGADGTRVLTRVAMPTRAHGLWREAGGTLLTVARRPGPWLARWQPATGGLLRQVWAEPGRQFNGHVLATPDGRGLLSTEQDQSDGAGLVALRDTATLALRDEWPTHGTDPHQLLWVGDRVFVANGGVPTRPETGRARRELPAMDSSLVLLDGRSGRLLGQWRLADRRLSLRHLAWHAPTGTLGIALQAELDDPAERARAPLLALFDGQGLRSVAPPTAAAGGWSGYAGDIGASADGFRLSATRAGLLLDWTARGGWSVPVGLAEVCALGGQEWALGAERGWHCGEGGVEAAEFGLPAACRPDNHALVLG
jgi:hypothetical protein